jgi:hypothetical protein
MISDFFQDINFSCLHISHEHRLSQDDLLFMQPTSVGMEVNNTFMGNNFVCMILLLIHTHNCGHCTYKGTLLEHYLPELAWDNNMDILRQERWRLIWPSREKMIQIQKQARGLISNRWCNSQNSQDIDKEGVSFSQGILFLHARNFALMETDIQSQFYTYAPSQAKSMQPLTKVHAPHIKSYGRIYGRSAVSSKGKTEEKLEESITVNQCCCYELAWTMITSTCLSRGWYCLRRW